MHGTRDEKQMEKQLSTIFVSFFNQNSYQEPRIKVGINYYRLQIRSECNKDYLLEHNSNWPSQINDEM